MAYKKVFDGQTDKTIQLGGRNNTTGIENPKSIEGYFLGTKDTESGDYGPGKLHIFQTKEGTVGVWGKTRLNRILGKSLIGKMVLVNFTGMVQATKKGRKPSYGYEAFGDDENTIDVSSLDLNATATVDDEDLGDEEQGGEEETYADEAPTARATAPATPASVPNAARAAKVQALLNRARA